jgi:hypothetical protein
MSDTFFGIQLALDLAPGHRLRAELAALVRSLRPGGGALPAQRALWTQASTALIAALPSAVLGTWDLIRDRGDAEYEDWASGLEAMATWPDADFGDGTLLLASVIVLVAADSNADRTLGDRCDLPEREWLRRGTYRRLLGVPPLLNFTQVLGSGLYLAPHPDQRGFAHAVLTGDGFGYLDPLS